jgi:hypothetical protein
MPCTRSSSATPTSSGQSGLRSIRPVRLDSAGHAWDGEQAQPYASMASSQQGHRLGIVTSSVYGKPLHGAR